MFHLEVDEGVPSDDTGVIQDWDEPLSMRLRRRSSSVSNDETSNSYSNDSFTTGTSAEENSDDAMRPTKKISDIPSSATVINFQLPTVITPTPPMAFSFQSPQKPFMEVQQQQPKPQPVKRQEKRTKRRRDVKSASTFHENYYLTGQMLGRGAYATVHACLHRATNIEYAVKVIEKRPENSRTRVIKEIETFHICAGHPNIVQLIEYFEEDDKFYLVFEKMRGGPLLNHIQSRICFTEYEACLVVRDIANALKFLHDKGIAHRDLKPENILCTYPDRVSPVKICDLDLASKMVMHAPAAITTPELQSPVGSAEFMAPEVVDAFVGEALSYDKRCDLWSLGVILYIMLCGYPPFYGECDREDCGWDMGLPCQDCQDSLFVRIQTGEYDFPEPEWSGISDRAKDLISHLLVKDASRRYTVDDVIRHDWLHTQAPKKPLMTPDVLSRNDSARDLKQLESHFRYPMGQITNFGHVAEEEPLIIGPVTTTAKPGTMPRNWTPIDLFKDMTFYPDRRGQQQQ